jgi:hypothetical protein
MPPGGGTCDTSKITIVNTTAQVAMIQPGMTANFSFPVQMTSMDYGASGLCSFNMTVNYQVLSPRASVPPRKVANLHLCEHLDQGEWTEALQLKSAAWTVLKPA